MSYEKVCRIRSRNFANVLFDFIMSESPQILDLIEWLSGNEAHDLEDAGLVGALGRRLSALGIPLDLLTLHLRTLHPEILARTIAWAPNMGVHVYDREYDNEQSELFFTSPIHRVMESREEVRIKVNESSNTERLELDVFRRLELTELLIWPLVSSEGPVSAATFGTRRSQGFSPRKYAMLSRIVPTLRSVCEVRALRQAEVTLLDTYIGAVTGRRILAGQVRRGQVETLEAALMLIDLRGFTELSNRLPSYRVLDLLNIYFDQVVPEITRVGGEILKFMGDSVLAFVHRSSGARESCDAALDATLAALARVESLSFPDARLAASASLHHGLVSYGNIGSSRRLDFTVIGPDVNLTSRIQSACAASGRRLCMSKNFAELVSGPGAVPIGSIKLKGFADPVEMFEWEERIPTNNG